MDKMQEELGEIEQQKAIVIKRFQDIRSGLHQISSDKENKLPHLKWYDSILKQIHNTFRETQNRMEFAMLMKRK